MTDSEHLFRGVAKAHATLRLDADMLDWFKAQGRGYQAKINAVLRSYFQQRSR